jgi:hypothetical protein
MAPVSLPAAFGLNSALKVTDWLGVSVCGVLNPDMPNPVPVTLTDLIAALSVPLFVNRSVWVDGLPTITFPKPTVDGVILSELVAPIPVRLPITWELCVPVMTEILPFSWPAEVGLKAAVSCRL